MKLFKAYLNIEKIKKVESVFTKLSRKLNEEIICISCETVISGIKSIGKDFYELIEVLSTSLYEQIS